MRHERHQNDMKMRRGFVQVNNCANDLRWLWEVPLGPLEAFSEETALVSLEPSRQGKDDLDTHDLIFALPLPFDPWSSMTVMASAVMAASLIMPGIRL